MLKFVGDAEIFTRAINEEHSIDLYVYLKFS